VLDHVESVAQYCCRSRRCLGAAAENVSATTALVGWWASRRGVERNQSVAPSTPSRNHRIGTQYSCGLPQLAHGMRRRACGSVDILIACAHTVAKDPRPPRRRSCVRREQAQCLIRTRERRPNRSATTGRPLSTKRRVAEGQAPRSRCEERVLPRCGTRPMRGPALALHDPAGEVRCRSRR
jgi:hypothetical protein